MPRQLQVYLPATVDSSKRAEVEAFLRSRPEVVNYSSFSSPDSYLYVFRIDDKRAAQIIEGLENIGVGVDFGTIDIMQLLGTKPLLVSTAIPKQRYRLHDRIPAEEIYESIDSRLHLTFDFILYTFLASVISGVGLLTGSAVTVVAAMVLDPFMSPILGITLATVTKNKSMLLKSLRNEITGVCMAFLIGIVIGIPPAFIDFQQDGAVNWGNQEMMSRGSLSGIWTGIAIAIPCGAAAALSVVSIQGGPIALVGVGISAALVPPVVNSGMNASYGAMAIFFEDKHIPATDGWKWLTASLYSIALFAVNFFCIYGIGILIFKMKRVDRFRDVSLRNPKNTFGDKRRNTSIYSSEDSLAPIHNEYTINAADSNQVGIQLDDEFTNK